MGHRRMIWLRNRLWISFCFIWAIGCSATLPSNKEGTSPPPPAFEFAKRAAASDSFWRYWGDGNAEVASYRSVHSRYGSLRNGFTVLIFVTEPLDKTTMIKDDAVEEAQKLNVMKLNHQIFFETGIYPYTVMTSLFAPVDHYAEHRFSPTKIALSVQEWCGHVYQQIRPGKTYLWSQLHSYFANEGDTIRVTPIESSTVFEDALWIQLREFDGPFHTAPSWSGMMVPSLWSVRKRHEPLKAIPVTIERSTEQRDGNAVVLFTVKTNELSYTLELESEYPHRIVRWNRSDGERGELIKALRIPYWKLNNVNDGHYRQELGLPSVGESAK